MLKKLLQGIKAFIQGGTLPTPEECRETPRLFCQYRANVRHQDRDWKASVVDIGATGVGLEGGEKVSSGDMIRISYPLSGEFVEENAVDVEVVWCRVREHDKKVLVGARYTTDQPKLESSWVWTLLHELGMHKNTAFQKRKHVRLATALKAELRELESGRFLTQGNVNNLSVGGALIESDESIKKGTEVLALIGPHINYPTLSIHGRLINSRDDDVGGAQLHSIQFIDINKKQMKSLESLILKMLSGQG